MIPRNLLLIVLDQFRADLLDGALAAVVPTPNLDALAERSVSFQNHHSVVVPCGPSRASLLTGQYAMTHGSWLNSMPLPRHIPTFASELRKIGREPLLFGYTDTQPDPAGLAPDDPAHRSYTGPMPGFTEVLEMRDEAWSWLAYLRNKGYDVPDAETPDFQRLYRPADGVLGGPAIYKSQDSDTAFLTDQTIAQLDVRKSRPWSAMVTYIRPHPPFVAPAPYNDLVDPQTVPKPIAPPEHPFFSEYHSEPSLEGMFWGFEGDQKSLTQETIAKVRATYLGLVAEVDHNVGRLLRWLDDTGQREDTLIVLTADHGEMLGDLGIWGKQTPFRQASHIPLLLSGPGLSADRINHPTQSIDVVPTVLALMGSSPPQSMNGRSLLSDSPQPGAMTELQLPSGNRAVAWQTQNQRLVTFGNDMPQMLFDTEQDPYCSQDIAFKNCSDVKALTAQILKHRLRY